MSAYRTLQDAAFEANRDLYESGLVVATFGNVSAFDGDGGVFAIKPSGVPYPSLTPRTMVVVDLENRVVEGTLRPSSDTKTHAVLYSSFPGIGGVCHTHSPYAVAWAQAQRPIPILGTTHADHLTVDIPCTEVMEDRMIAGDYETETGNQIVNHFREKSHKEIPMVLVARHGPFTWGESAAKALYNSIMLEELAKMAFITMQIDPSVARLGEALINKHYQRKHGSSAYYGQK
ncbi:MAG: L-ribulose-5-phosphate 4-epimerase AraD [Chitinispirillaceae bacterium]|nr:L-ribulose-5-phosphate 4-epimerase AraD [Chitinispirillaceae bacterium]